MNIYRGALYENIVGDMFVKAGYDLYFYKDDSKKKQEMDFFVRDTDSWFPNIVIKKIFERKMRRKI